jgi:hypothetical protein
MEGGYTTTGDGKIAVKKKSTKTKKKECIVFNSKTGLF